MLCLCWLWRTTGYSLMGFSPTCLTAFTGKLSHLKRIASKLCSKRVGCCLEVGQPSPPCSQRSPIVLSHHILGNIGCRYWPCHEADGVWDHWNGSKGAKEHYIFYLSRSPALDSRMAGYQFLGFR